MPGSLAPPSGPPKRLTLRVGLSTAFVTMVLSTAVIICGLLLDRMHDIMRADLRQRMRDVATMAALGISGDAHRDVHGPEDEGTENFLALKRHLQSVKASVPDLRFAYTIRQLPDGKLAFWTDAETGDAHRDVHGPEDERTENYLALKRHLQNVKASVPDLRFAYTIRQQPDGRLAFWIDAETDAEGTHVGDEVTVVTATLKEAFQKPTQPYVEPEFYTDQWGTWLSGYAPIFGSDGKFECFVGVDVSAARVAEREWAAIQVALVSAGLLTLLVAGVGLWLSSRIVHPMAVLEANMARVRDLHLEDVDGLHSRFHEIERMADTLSAMKSGLRSFSKYVPTELVRELIHDGTEAALGARRAELTIFFSDIEGFTTLAESTTPEGLAEDLADYFALITGTILDAGGTVDKYIGDAVMAFWGAPKPLPDHALRAVATALLIHERLAALNERRRTEGRLPIVTRIGLSTGEVVVGNFGYSERMNYTVMGDHVNLSSRLEGLNKYVGTTLLVSESTVKHAGGAVVARLLGAVAVKGKKEGVRIYEPVALRDSAPPALLARVDEWNAAVARFLERDFDAALPVFEAWAADHPDDEPARQKIDACRQHIALPPDETWSGLVVMNTK